MDAAITAFHRSHSEFSEALDIAKNAGLGDDKGLGLLTKLRDQVGAIDDVMAKQKTLPTLTEVQAVATLANEYTAHGIELGKKHLKEGLPGHGEGGSAYKIK